MISWWNGNLANWWVDKMSSWQDDEMMKWQVDEKVSFNEIKFMHWQVDVIASKQNVCWQNVRWTNNRSDEMTSWKTRHLVYQMQFENIIKWKMQGCQDGKLTKC